MTTDVGNIRRLWMARNHTLDGERSRNLHFLKNNAAQSEPLSDPRERAMNAIWRDRVSDFGLRHRRKQAS